MNVQIHPDLREIVEREILPTLGFQGLGVPARADLQIMGLNPYDSGVAEINIADNGALSVAYTGFFSPCISPMALVLERQTQRVGPVIASFSEGDKLIMRGDTAVEVPLTIVLDNRFMNSDQFTQRTGQHHGYISGWYGGASDTKMRSARLTFQIPQDLGLADVELCEPDTGDGNLTMKYRTRHWALNLQAGEWCLQLLESTNIAQPVRLQHVTLKRQDGSPFTLSDETPLAALRYFLSFMVGEWCEQSTILCDPVNPNDTVERVYIGRLTPCGASQDTHVPARLWPRLFREFWALYTHNDPKQRKHLELSIHHYVASQSRRLDNSDSVEQANTDINAAKEAVSRWWNGFSAEYQHGKRNLSAKESLFKAVQKADLGKDDDQTIDTEAMESLYSRKHGATNLRNVIVHGGDRSIGWEHNDILKCLMHDQNLVRLLILAKLGYRGLEDKIYRSGPEFVNRKTD